MLKLLGNDGIVLGIDIDIRQHNKVEIEAGSGDYHFIINK